MPAKSSLARLDDMQEAIAGIEEDVAGMSFPDFLASRKTRWSIERGIEIISGRIRRQYTLCARGGAGKKNTVTGFPPGFTVTGFHRFLVFSTVWLPPTPRPPAGLGARRQEARRAGIGVKQDCHGASHSAPFLARDPAGWHRSARRISRRRQAARGSRGAA